MNWFASLLDPTVNLIAVLVLIMRYDENCYMPYLGLQQQVFYSDFLNAHICSALRKKRIWT